MLPKTAGGASLNHPAEEESNEIFMDPLCLGDIEFFVFDKKFYHKIQGVKYKMSEAAIAQKQLLVEELTTKIQESASVVVVDYLGLTVEQVTELRKQLREAGVEMKVIKNSLMTRAAVAAGLEGMESIFKGPTAVAFSTEDVVAPAKIMAEFAKTADKLEIKGGIIEGKVASKEEIEALATLPNREGMLSMLLSVLQAPVRNFALAIKAVSEKDGAAA